MNRCYMCENFKQGYYTKKGKYKEGKSDKYDSENTCEKLKELEKHFPMGCINIYLNSEDTCSDTCRYFERKLDKSMEE